MYDLNQWERKVLEAAYNLRHHIETFQGTFNFMVPSLQAELVAAAYPPMVVIEYQPEAPPVPKAPSETPTESQ